MKVGLAQINTTVGDLAGNVDRCLEAVRQAESQGAELVVLPEMALPGYPPRDILFDSSFIEAVSEATLDLARQTTASPDILVGSLVPADHRPPGHPGLYNAALLLSGGKVTTAAAKQLLPGYDVYYEPRWFLPGPPLPPVTIAGERVGVLICEDLWDEGYQTHPADDVLEAGAQILISIHASPYRRRIFDRRLYQARRPGCPLVFVNQVGANDELIFDGRSFALDGKGQLIACLSAFEEEVQVIDLDQARPLKSAEPQPEAELFQALVLGVRDFAHKNRLEGAFLGLSGGIDSALVAVIAAEALGPERVTAVAIPSRYTDPRSIQSARELAQALGIGLEVVPLEDLHSAAETTLGELLGEGTTAENVQARLRAMILMSFVNHHGGMLLNTSNKTELSLGYTTLYGDMAGSLCPIADLTKPDVVALAGWIAGTRGLIPRFTLERPPSAELRPDQVDPFDYPTLSPLIEELVQTNRSNQALRHSEHKRWQMGVVLKVSEKSFGSGRMIPITRR